MPPKWKRPIIDIPATPGPSWPVEADPVDEPDGGTFYRPPVPTWHNTSNAPLPDLGDEGDYALDTVHHSWYGPKGEEDEEGNGEWGDATLLPVPETPAVWRNSPTDPEATDGNDGDFWLNTSLHTYWGPKSGGTWADTGPIVLVAEWIELEQPLWAGLFSIPTCAIGVGDDESEAAAAVAYLETADENGQQIQLIEMANLSVNGGPATSEIPSPLLVRLKQARKVRFVIAGDEGLTWELSGSAIEWMG